MWTNNSVDRTNQRRWSDVSLMLYRHWRLQSMNLRHLADRPVWTGPASATYSLPASTDRITATNINQLMQLCWYSFALCGIRDSTVFGSEKQNEVVFTHQAWRVARSCPSSATCKKPWWSDEIDASGLQPSNQLKRELVIKVGSVNRAATRDDKLKYDIGSWTCAGWHTISNTRKCRLYSFMIRVSNDFQRHVDKNWRKFVPGCI